MLLLLTFNLILYNTHDSSTILVPSHCTVLHFQFHLTSIPYAQPLFPLMHTTLLSLVYLLLIRGITLGVERHCYSVHKNTIGEWLPNISGRGGGGLRQFVQLNIVYPQGAMKFFRPQFSIFSLLPQI